MNSMSWSVLSKSPMSAGGGEREKERKERGSERERVKEGERKERD